MKIKLLLTMCFFALLNNVTKAQTALDFDGNNDYVSSPLTLGVTDNFTIECYTQYRAISGTYKTIFGFGSDVEIKILNTNQIGYVQANSSRNLITPVTLTDGQWYHFALVRRAGTWEFYIDGVYHPCVQGTTPSGNSSIQIGGRTTSESYNGVIDECRAWTVARTATEIATYRNSCLVGNEPGLLVYYNMESDIGTAVLKDLSCMANDAQLNNMDIASDWVSSAGHSGCQSPSSSLQNVDFSAATDSLCTSGSSAISSTTSQSGDTYYLRDDANNTVIDGPTVSTGGPITFNTGNITTSMTYNILAVNGSDSSEMCLFVDIFVGNANTGVDVQVACNSLTWIDGQTYTSNNTTATHTLTNIINCDSVVTLNLTINGPATSSQNFSGCDSLNYNAIMYYTDTIIKDTITGGAQTTCDSIVTTTLTITTIDTSVTNSAPLLTANATGATYQWIDCANGNTAITGATNANYTVTANGSYAVVVTANNCTDTSACIPVTTIGINSIGSMQNIDIFPNPSEGLFTIRLDELDNNARITISSVVGKEIISQAITKNNTTINLESYNNGIYFVKIQNGNDVIIKRIVKQ